MSKQSVHWSPWVMHLSAHALTLNGSDIMYVSLYDLRSFSPPVGGHRPGPTRSAEIYLRPPPHAYQLSTLYSVFNGLDCAPNKQVLSRHKEDRVNSKFFSSRSYAYDKSDRMGLHLRSTGTIRGAYLNPLSQVWTDGRQSGHGLFDFMSRKRHSNMYRHCTVRPQHGASTVS